MTSDNTSPRDQDTHSKRIKFRKTETSRLKSVADETSEDKDQVALPTEPKPATQAPSGRTSVVDPMALRDTSTSKVKRVQAAKDSSPLSTVSLPGAGEPLKKTETVQLKVVQQKKKELDDEMNPSSTVRLKSPASGPSVALPKTRPGSAPRDTMKISLPKLEKRPAEGTGDQAATVAVKPPPAEKPAGTADVTAPPQTVKTSTTVLEKEKATKSKSKSGTADTASATEETKSGGTPKAASGRTLKIKSGPKSAKTLKVKPEGSEKTVAVAATGSDEAKTIKVDDLPGKGLKLKNTKRTTADAPILQEKALDTGKKTSAPGVFYTLGAVATLVAVATSTYFLVVQAVEYIF